ncbi:hypothetical protein HK104_002481 [Borealophlyctis nickersoniae]|nr:hypothetical protein HK104_002481 [Borealophlyctis nickersoniae]
MALTMLLVACPVLSIFLIDAAVSSAIVGLYLSYPFVLYAGALLGVFGASSATFLVGLASASATLLRSQTSPPSSETDLPLTQQLIWVQLFLAVLIFTALTFVTILSERDKAYEHVENMVRVRTGELVEALKRLDAAKERAETTARDKATFLSFLCHELRNPLHAITNMAEFLLEDLKDGHRDRKAASLGQPRDSDEEFLRSTFMSESPLTSNPVCAPDRCSSRSSVATPDSQARAIKLSSEYMLALVNDVLDMGRFEAGRVDLERIPVDLHALLDNNVECARELVRAHGVHFTTDIGADVPKWVETDPVRLQQVLNNLVSNAYKFTPEGGKITLTVKVENSRELDWNGDKVGRKGNIGAGDEAKDNPTEGDILGYMSSDQTLQSATEITPSTVSRSTSAAAESTTTCVSLLFSVSDTGIGIDPAIVSTLFRPYAQAAVSTMREYGGSGLGLAITDRIIWLMGGQVWVDSEMGKGSTFTFRIPVSMVEEPPGGGEGWTFGAGNGGKRRAKGRGSEWRKDGAVDGDGPVIAPVRKEDVEAVLDAVHVVSIGDEVCGTHSVDLRGELEGAKDTLDVADTNGAPAPAPLSVTLSSGSLPSPAPNAADDTLLRPSILVVDDSTINRSILIRMLKRQLPEKYLIEEAENGQEAVEKVRRRLMRSGGVEANYRIIFMDIVMPILDGYQATHLIRTRLHCTSPVVITTANQVSGNLEAQEKLRQIGADEAVGKPFMKDKLIEVLRRYNVL